MKIIFGTKEEIASPNNEETNNCFRRESMSSNLTFKIIIETIKPIVKIQKAA